MFSTARQSSVADPTSDPALLLAAKEQVEAALGELTTSVVKAQRNLSAATEALRTDGGREGQIPWPPGGRENHQGPLGSKESLGLMTRPAPTRRSGRSPSASKTSAFPVEENGSTNPPRRRSLISSYNTPSEEIYPDAGPFRTPERSAGAPPERRAPLRDNAGGSGPPVLSVWQQRLSMTSSATAQSEAIAEEGVSVNNSPGRLERARGTSQDTHVPAAQAARQEHAAAARPSRPSAGSSASSDCEFVAETLPLHWPRTLRRKWEVTGVSRTTRGTELSGCGSGKLSSRMQKKISMTSEFEKAAYRTLINPMSAKKLLYDAIAIAFMALDFMMIPWMLGWDVDIVDSIFLTALVTTTFWTVDIGVTFRTGFQSHGEVVFDSHAIARKYIRSWLVPDVLVVTVDWVTLLATRSLGMRMFRFAKLGRLIRLASTFRVMKFARLWEDLMDVYGSAKLNLVIKFLTLFFITLSLSHLIACVWFLIGRQAPSDTGARWISSRQYSKMFEVDTDFDESDMQYQYATSFHWAMSHLTLGAMEVAPTTTIERIFSVLCLITGLLFGSTLVSTLSAAFFEVQMDARETRVKMQMMRRYLKENKVNRKVAMQVESQLSERLAIRDQLSAEQVYGLQLLSGTMLNQLHFSMYEQYLQRQAIFRLWVNTDLAIAQILCRQCLHFGFLRSQDDLFVAGQPADWAYLFVSGGLNYIQDPDTSPHEDTFSTYVAEGSWLAEAALWIQWIHVGTACATAYSKVLEVDVTKVLEVGRAQGKNPIIVLTQDYARKFHQRMQNARPPTSAWPNDLQVPLTEWADMVCCLSRESQIIIARDALKQAASGTSAWFWRQRGMAELAKQIDDGKSTLMLTDAGELRRMVSVVALKICNPDGEIFARVAKRDSPGGKLAPALELPGCKKEHGEMVPDTMERLLEEKLSPLAGHVLHLETQQEVVDKESAQLTVQTRYFRSIVHARLTSGGGIEAFKLPRLSHEVRRRPSEKLQPGSPNQKRGDPFDTESRPGTPSNPSKERVGLAMLRVSRTSSDHGRRESKDSSSVDQNATVLNRSVVLQRDAYLIGGKGAECLYCWLPEQELEMLQDQRHHDLVAAWMSTLAQRVEEFKSWRNNVSTASSCQALTPDDTPTTDQSRPTVPAGRGFKQTGLGSYFNSSESDAGRSVSQDSDPMRSSSREAMVPMPDSRRASGDSFGAESLPPAGTTPDGRDEEFVSV